MVKKLTALLLALFMVIGLTACSFEEITSDVSSGITQGEISESQIVDSSVSEASSETVSKEESLNSSKTSSTHNTYSSSSSSKVSTSSKTSSSQVVSKPQASNNTQSKGNTVTVPEKSETTGNLVWVPTNGGKKYHSKSSCSNMKDPIQVSKETAVNNGYEPCKRCF